MRLWLVVVLCSLLVQHFVFGTKDREMEDISQAFFTVSKDTTNEEFVQWTQSHTGLRAVHSVWNSHIKAESFEAALKNNPDLYIIGPTAIRVYNKQFVDDFGQRFTEMSVGPQTLLVDGVLEKLTHLGALDYFGEVDGEVAERLVNYSQSNQNLKKLTIHTPRCYYVDAMLSLTKGLASHKAMTAFSVSLFSIDKKTKKEIRSILKDTNIKTMF